MKNKSIFLLIAAAAFLAALLSVFAEYLGENPVKQYMEAENPVQLAKDGGYYYYVTDSSETILVADKENRLVRRIEGGEDSFSYAAELAWDDEHNLYVLDRLYTDNGSYTYQEQILKLDENGKTEEVCYSLETLGEDDRQCRKISAIRINGRTLTFAQTDEEAIRVFQLEEGEAQEICSLELEDAFSSVADVALDSNGNAAVALKNGDVYVQQGDDLAQIYHARDYDDDEYFSLISEITYDSEGNLYLCDIGLRKILCIARDSGQPQIVVDRSTYAEADAEEFAQMPLYTGIIAEDGMLSFMSATYQYIPETQEEIHTYELTALSLDGALAGEKICSSAEIGISTGYRIRIVIAYAAAAVLAGILLYICLRLFGLLREKPPESSVVIQIVVLVTALGVTCGVGYYIFQACNDNYIQEVGDNLSNVAYRIGQSIPEEDISQIASPDAYNQEYYKETDEIVKEILSSKNNADSEMYCVIYKVFNNVVCEAYRDDGTHSPMYPMAGQYSGAVEERIAADDDYNVTYESLSEGAYIYALVPVYGTSGEAIAFVEVGMDFASFSAQNQALFTGILLAVVMVVIICLLLFSEVVCGVGAVRGCRLSRKEKIPCPPEVIRPLSFVFFLIANLSTAFLPIYGKNLWDESFPLKVEMAAALPISAEFVTAAVSAFICGFLIRKTGVKLICIIGAFCYVGGNLLSAFAGNLWLLIVANGTCGIGSGLLSIAFNAWAAGYEDEEKQNKGFIHINAAYLAGLNCGTVVGSLLWNHYGIRNTFLISAGAGGLLILMVILMIGEVKVDSGGDEEDGGTGKLRDLLKMPVFRYFLFISVPYLICTAFLEYFFPIVADESGLSSTGISMAFLISGMISIYMGASLAETITDKLGAKQAMILASFLYVAALFYLVANPTIWSCYVVIAVFAVADSFGLSAQSVYYSSLPAVIKAGQSKALGVNNTVESITSACGSLVFGAALILGVRQGILIIAAAFGLLLLFFVLGERRQQRRERKRESQA